ncbi:MAG TPA: hypothetical protein VJX94_08180 [Stellaceae bacterium]|nr:hypothetical protein [Stellaceae bacterium]
MGGRLEALTKKGRARRARRARLEQHDVGVRSDRERPLARIKTHDLSGRLPAAELHEADYTPWEGRDLAAWPSLVMLRGKIVVEGNTFAGDLKDGQFLSRKVPEEIRTRPTV